MALPLLCSGAAGEIARAVRAGTLPRCARQRIRGAQAGKGTHHDCEGRTLRGAGRALARWGVAQGSREPRRANDAAIPGRELERRRGPHAVLRPPRQRSMPYGRTTARPDSSRRSPQNLPRTAPSGAPVTARPPRLSRLNSRSRRRARRPRSWVAAIPGSLTTPGANPGTGTPRKSRPAGSRTSRPSGATSRNCRSNKHIPLISRISGANPEKGLSYPERPPGPRVSLPSRPGSLRVHSSLQEGSTRSAAPRGRPLVAGTIRAC